LQAVVEHEVFETLTPLTRIVPFFATIAPRRRPRGVSEKGGKSLLQHTFW
jgi:hypothetical protein